MSRLSRPVAACALLSLGLAACVPSHRLVPNAGAQERGCGPPSDRADGARVAWYAPEREGDRDRLDAWCAAVGPPVVETGARPLRGLSAGDSLRVVSWNLDGRSADVVRFLRDELGLCSPTYGFGAPDPGARAPHHTVLLLQEAVRRSADIPPAPRTSVVPRPIGDGPAGRPDLPEIAKRCGLSAAYVPSARNGREEDGGPGEDRGNAVLSTLPLSDVTAIELPFEGSRRVAVAATIGGPDGRALRIASIHLHTVPRPWRALTTGNASRMREAAALVHALRDLDRTGSGDAPTTIVAGDLNTWSARETAIKRLRTHFPDSPPALDEPTRGPFPTDHILFRTAASAGDLIEAGSYRRVDRTFESDHHPLEIWVRIGH